jgi:hypothetical protein
MPRCIVQLSLLGYILVPIFTTNKWWLTALYTLFMLTVAAMEAVSRPAQSYPGMLPQASWGGRHMLQRVAGLTQRPGSSESICTASASRRVLSDVCCQRCC